MSRLLICLVAFCLAPVSTFSQDIGVSIGGGVVQANGQPPRDARLATGHSAIRGRVLASDGGQPLRRATVRINAAELRVARTAFTDADGRYDFRDLPAGRYSISASKPTFVNWSYGQTLPNGPGKPIALSDNQTADNVDMRLLRGAVITGRVLDEFGEPVPNAAVTALRRQYQQGQSRLSPAGDRAQANDIGDYRIFGLAPTKSGRSIHGLARLVCLQREFRPADSSGDDRHCHWRHFAVMGRQARDWNPMGNHLHCGRLSGLGHRQ